MNGNGFQQSSFYNLIFNADSKVGTIGKAVESSIAEKV